MVKQGTIIKVNFNPQSGHEQAGYRPAIVISNNIFNQKTNLNIVYMLLLNLRRRNKHKYTHKENI